jgi:hypothetical protein
MEFNKPQGYGFTFSDYTSTLRRFKEDGYAVTGFAEYLSSPREKHLIMRHDCDNSIDQALKIAELDASEGCTSTFFVRVHALGYNLMSLPTLRAIREIERMGHGVELHLEGGLDEFLGGETILWAERQKAVFEAALGRSLTGFSSHEPARMGGVEFANSLLKRWAGEVSFHAYEERFTTPEMKYLSDSSGRWREGHFGLWVGKEPLFQVLTHPIWWFEKVPAENY